MTNYIKSFFSSLFFKIDTCHDAIYKDLLFIRNVYGDEINHRNCRSIWEDKYGFQYRCNRLMSEKLLHPVRFGENPKEAIIKTNIKDDSFDTQWHHIKVDYSKETIKTYLDDKLIKIVYRNNARS